MMNATIGALVLALATTLPASARQDKRPPAGDTNVADRRPTSGSAVSKSDRAALERRFRESLSNVVFQGTWQMTRETGPDGKTVLTDPQPDRYAISRVTKIAGDRWLVMARMQHGDTDVTLPIPVRVVWAGDTPIITLDDIAMPGVGTYTARVMVYRDFYSGAWFGDGYGGILSGRILKAADADASNAATAPPNADRKRAATTKD